MTKIFLIKKKEKPLEWRSKNTWDESKKNAISKFILRTTEIKI